MTRLERFMAKVLVNQKSNCWEWTGSKILGYGRFRTDDGVIAAHHFLLNPRPVPPMKALHKCDNPACVNPEHIWIGTQMENVHDCMRKGRRGKLGNKPGEECPSSKLINWQVDQIKNTPKTRGSGARLSERFGVSAATISLIRGGKRWQMAS